MHINGTSEKFQIIYKWNVLSASGTVVGWSQWASLLLFSFQSIINTNVLLQIYIVSVVKLYVFIISVQYVFLLLLFCFFFPPKAELKLLLLFCILTLLEFEHEGPVHLSRKK